MDKEEAMKILKDFHDKSALFSVRTALDTIIPELREPEDERIRKELIEHIKANCKTGFVLFQKFSPDDDTQVEYIRKDALIKKAAAYLNEKFYFNNLHYAVENNTFNCMEELFEDFKEYMED